MLSPLQLHRYYIEEVFCKANPAFNNEHDINVDSFKVFFETGDDKDPLKRRIRLTISQDITKTGNEPFAFKVVLVGFFEVVKEFFDDQGPEKTEQLVNVNGPALLYSAGREMLAIVTGRGPYSDKGLDILLPSITFLHFKPMKKAEEKSSVAKRTRQGKTKKGT